jgi:iron complex transport system permease protein
LAEPYVLGISAGASTGAVAVMILGFGYGVLTLSTGAFIGAVVAFLLVSLLAAGSGGGADRIILAGVAGSQLFNALTSYIVTTSANAEQARGVMFWLLGSLSGVRWPDVYLAGPVAIGGFLICLLYARALDAFTFGTDAAAALGIPVGRVRIVLLGLTALLTATMVSIVGSIGFVGLVIPHAARFLVGPGHGRLLPATAITGAIFMVVADIVSRIIIPQQILPIGVVTALFGAPAFAFILYKARQPV